MTGDPTPVETLRLAILTAVRLVVPERGARIVLAQTVPPLQPLPAVSELALRAFMQVTTAGSKPVTRTVPVEIAHVVFPWSDAADLLVSNNPEMLSVSRVLFSSALWPSQVVRLLYHHQNGSAARGMTLMTTLTNGSRTQAAVLVTGASAESGSDELALGHAAARDFLDQYWQSIRATTCG